MDSKNVLFLIPNVLSDSTYADVLPPHVKEAACSAKNFFVEDLRAARRLLARLHHPASLDALHFYELSEHTAEMDVPSFLPALLDGPSGVISEAGVPVVADPGKAIVRLAHEHGVRVVPLVGPSSILMALCASGMNGQNFAFVGYLPVKPAERLARIRELERRSEAEGQTQIFIETPYRNQALLTDIIAACKPETRLCIASNITAADESIATRSIRQWQAMKPAIGKVPTVWLIEGVGEGRKKNCHSKGKHCITRK